MCLCICVSVCVSQKMWSLNPHVYGVVSTCSIHWLSLRHLPCYPICAPLPKWPLLCFYSPNWLQLAVYPAHCTPSTSGLSASPKFMILWTTMIFPPGYTWVCGIMGIPSRIRRVSRQKAANVLENGCIHYFLTAFGGNVCGKSPETVVRGRTLNMKPFSSRSTEFYQNIHNTASIWSYCR